MGKFRTSLLSIVFQLLLTAAIFANEGVRKVQEELRKRHLFFGNIDGKITPALTAAVAGYQAKKGFTRTGLIDSEVSASLGIVEPAPRIAGMPFVVDNSDIVRGPNGEQLPFSAASGAIAAERPVESERTMSEQDHIAPALPGTGPKSVSSTEISTRRSSASRVRRSQARKETNPLVLAYQTVDRALKFLAGESDPKKKRSGTKRF